MVHIVVAAYKMYTVFFWRSHAFSLRGRFKLMPPQPANGIACVLSGSSCYYSDLAEALAEALAEDRKSVSSACEFFHWKIYFAVQILLPTTFQFLSRPLPPTLPSACCIAQNMWWDAPPCSRCVKICTSAREEPLSVCVRQTDSGCVHQTDSGFPVLCCCLTPLWHAGALSAAWDSSKYVMRSCEQLRAVDSMQTCIFKKHFSA